MIKVEKAWLRFIEVVSGNSSVKGRITVVNEVTSYFFPPCKCKYCHKKSCNQVNVILKKECIPMTTKSIFLYLCI